MKRFCKEISEYLKEYSMDHEDPVYINNIDHIAIVASPSWKSWDGKFDTYNYFKVIIFDQYKSYTEYIDIKDRMNVNIKIYRISLYNPEYINDKIDYGYMSKKELNIVINASREEGLSVWQNIIKNLNWEHSDDYKIHGIRWNKIPQDLPIPDYSLLPTRD